ncbi:hypothetical protein QJQ45_029234, partial [Haematococcus lacustris]
GPQMAISNAGFNAVSGHTFAICSIEAHWRGPKPTAMLKAKQKAGKSGTPSSSRLRAALTESEKLAKAENQAVSRKRTRFHRLGARYQRLGVLSTPGVQLNLRAANALSPWAPISPGLQQPWANMTLEGLGGHANLAMHNNDVALMREVYRVMKTREGAETNRFFKELHSQLRKLR